MNVGEAPTVTVALMNLMVANSRAKKGRCAPAGGLTRFQHFALELVYAPGDVMKLRDAETHDLG